VSGLCVTDSAIAEGPRDALYQPKYCHLLHHYTQQVIAPGAARRYAPSDGSSTRSGSTHVRGRVRSPNMAKLQAVSAELSIGWVDPWVGLGWVGSGWVEIFQFLVGWVGSTIAEVLKI